MMIDINELAEVKGIGQKTLQRVKEHINYKDELKQERNVNLKVNQLETNVIHNMDNIKGMRQLIPDNSIDLIVTSPPYDNIRDYEGNWNVNLSALGNEFSRVLVDGGIAIMIIQDQTNNGKKSLTSFKTIVDWCENTELNLWETCIYKRNGTPGNWWSKRFRVDHEYIPIFIKGKRPQYFSKEHMKVKPKIEGIQKSGGVRKTNGEVTDGFISTGKPKCCGTIIKYASSSQESIKDKKIKTKHPGTFPDKIANDFIKAFTKEKDIVLDPFMGSGTTLKMAKKLNRKYIGIDISQKYCEIAKKRIKQG